MKRYPKMSGHCYSGAAVMVCMLALFSAGVVSAKVRSIGPTLVVRPVTVRNIAYNANGTIFVVPNFVSAGSVAFFWVDEKGAIANVPARVSDKNFVRSAGLYFLRKKSDGEPGMAFAGLPELLSGYSVDFNESGDTLAIAGGDRVFVYSGGSEWKIFKEITAAAATRAVFSHNGKYLAVISEGKVLLMSTDRYTVLAAIEPQEGSKFADVAFSHSDERCALFEYHATIMDYGSRIRIYDCAYQRFDRDLPYFPLRPSKEPGVHLPAVSYSPGDSLLAVTLPATISGKVYLIKSNDGSVFKEFKGYCHAFSRDGSLFVAENSVFSTKDWMKLGKISSTTVACTFSPTERVLVTVTNDAIRRYRIEE